jgi:pimeloyl-ACP methyl ester carboxylesterase
MISFDELGDPAGFPVVFHCGTPCSRLLPRWWDPMARARGLRIVCFDRPGYGNCPAQPGSTIADVVAGTARGADALEIDRFATWGVSGAGVSFSFGCAALLGERVPAVVAVAGAVPNDGSQEWRQEWSAEYVEQRLEPALAGRRDLVAKALARSAQELRGFDVPAWLAAWAEAFSPADHEALDAETAGYLLANIQEALRPGIEGWLDDEISSVHPWGFDLGAIRQPVAIWHGDQDRIIEPAHAHRLAAQIPRAEVFIVEGHGHPSLILRHVEPVMDWIADRTSRQT